VNTTAVVPVWPSVVLATCLSLLAVTASGQSTPKPVGARFESVKSAFDIDVDALAKARGVEEGYNPADVNTTLRQTKDATLSSIPPKDKPLRVYVERSFPEPVDESTPAVQRDVVEKRFSLVRELLARLSRLDSFRLDLTVNTRPSHARFELVPRVGTPVSSTTNSRLTNIYRGEYDYTITKAGYKRVHETISFIERAGSVLECELQPDPGPEDALPCNFR
jgi:hypothetical protein